MPTDPLVHCQRCPELMPPPQLLEHVRLLHPDVEVEPVDVNIEHLEFRVGYKSESRTEDHD